LPKSINIPLDNVILSSIDATNDDNPQRSQTVIDGDMSKASVARDGDGVSLGGGDVGMQEERWGAETPGQC
jgi:hypothetical protein